jgi:hypothetical protein
VILILNGSEHAVGWLFPFGFSFVVRPSDGGSLRLALVFL